MSIGQATGLLCAVCTCCNIGCRCAHILKKPKDVTAATVRDCIIGHFGDNLDIVQKLGLSKFPTFHSTVGNNWHHVSTCSLLSPNTVYLTDINGPIFQP